MESDKALKRGLAWLKSIASDDHWLGFPTLAGRSDTWVTGFVVSHIAPMVPRSRIVTRARHFLIERQQTGGGWGYNPDVPADADSTAWCLAALARSRGLTPSARATAKKFLLEHCDIDGVRTFLPNSGISNFIEAPSGFEATGWMSPHPDVTAAALLSGSLSLPHAHQALQSIVSSQDRAGVLPASRRCIREP